MKYFNNKVIQVVLSYLILIILVLVILGGLLLGVPRYVAWNKIYFAKIDKYIEKNISKYLKITEKMIDTHDLGTYLRQRLQLINTSLDSLFVSEQTTLSEFF